MVSRPRAEPPAPKYITAAIIIISMPLMESVRTSVPRGSRTRSARPSAWRTTAKAEMAIAPSPLYRLCELVGIAFVDQCNLTRPLSHHFRRGHSRFSLRSG